MTETCSATHPNKVEQDYGLCWECDEDKLYALFEDDCGRNAFCDGPEGCECLDCKDLK